MSKPDSSSGALRAGNTAKIKPMNGMYRPVPWVLAFPCACAKVYPEATWKTTISGCAAPSVCCMLSEQLPSRPVHRSALGLRAPVLWHTWAAAMTLLMRMLMIPIVGALQAARLVMAEMGYSCVCLCAECTVPKHNGRDVVPMGTRRWLGPGPKTLSQASNPVRGQRRLQRGLLPAWTCRCWGRV